MNELLFFYERIHPTSWAFLASLLVVALYFKFSRLWSLRNLDLLLLILLAPPLLMIKLSVATNAAGQATVVAHIGYIWLLVVSGLILLRLLLDAVMVRRPLLEPNLTVGGLAFLGMSLYFALMANVIVGIPEATDLRDSQRAARLYALLASNEEVDALRTHGPSFPLLYLLPHIATQSLLGAAAEEGILEEMELGEAVEATDKSPPADPDESTEPLETEPDDAAPPTDPAESTAQFEQAELTETIAPAPPTGSERADRLVHVVTVRVMAMLSQLTIVLGLALVGMRHFDNLKTGIAAATLYLLLPYTALWTGSVTHALPGALLVAAILFYRWPVIAGGLIGLAFGTIYSPALLLPLWLSFYWQRGLWRFVIGLSVGVTLLMLVAALTSINLAMFFSHMQQMFAIRFPIHEGLGGVWQFWNPFFRVPLLVAFVCLALSFFLWPAHKNLGTLISYSAAVMVATQFWHAHFSGLALAWYLPLLLLTIFRPNLEERVAPAAVR